LGPGEIEVPVKIRAIHGRTKRPRGALLHLVVDTRPCLRSIGGSQRTYPLGGGGGIGEIPLWLGLVSNRFPLSGGGTPAGGEFDWGGRLPKGNGGAQWSPRREWKPREEECKSRRWLDCETDVSSRCESRV
jgi:hypothetical protein